MINTRVEIRREHLILALELAIRDQRKIEKDAGYDRDSMLLERLVVARDVLRAGNNIHIVD